jgi:succinoglycan biosynthesis transport protein ExoP
MLREIKPQQLGFSRPLDEGDTVLASPQFRGIMRHKRLVLSVMLLFGLLAVMFAALRSDSYTAVTKLLIDNKTLQLGRQDAVFARSEVDVPLIQNQIELLRSEKIASQVIDKFNLSDDPDFAGQRSFFLVRATPDDRRRLALEAFKRRLYVGRVGDSYTLDIRFTAASAQQAADIANQIGTDYIGLLVESNAKLAQSASPWLRPRLTEMGPNASVITTATPPLRKDGPGIFLLLPAALLFGAVLGITGALAVDMRDRSVRTPSQLVALTGVECPGIVPKMMGKDLLFEAVEWPKSYLTHTLRRTLAVIGERPELKVDGVVSAIPGEGKTTVAANLAQVAVTSGRRVLLIDAAGYDGGLSKVLTPAARDGLASVLTKKIPLTKALWSVSQLKFLPIGTESELAYASKASEFQRIISEASGAFDMIVVDLPPLTVVADVREIASIFDGFLLVAAWGKTPQEVITSALATNEPVQRKLLAAILNRVEIDELRTYGGPLSFVYDRAGYGSYLSNWAIARRFGLSRRRKKGAA